MTVIIQSFKVGWALSRALTVLIVIECVYNYFISRAQTAFGSVWTLFGLSRALSIYVTYLARVGWTMCT